MFRGLYTENIQSDYIVTITNEHPIPTRNYEQVSRRTAKVV